MFFCPCQFHVVEIRLSIVYTTLYHRGNASFEMLQTDKRAPLSTRQNLVIARSRKNTFPRGDAEESFVRVGSPAAAGFAVSLNRNLITRAQTISRVAATRRPPHLCQKSGIN